MQSGQRFIYAQDSMARLVHLALLQRLPKHSRRARWRRLAKKLSSPRTALWAAPALLLPILAAVMINEDIGPSPIEQTIEALPLPVAGQSAGATALSPGESPLGAAGTTPSPSVTMPIYNNSALALTAQMQAMNANRWYEPNAPLDELQQREYAALHPQERVGDDLLVGQVSTLLAMPISPDISFKIFLDFCNAKSGDPYYGVDVNSLPIDPELRASLVELASLTPDSGFCPRLSGKG